MNGALRQPLPKRGMDPPNGFSPEGYMAHQGGYMGAQEWGGDFAEEAGYMNVGMEELQGGRGPQQGRGYDEGVPMRSPSGGYAGGGPQWGGANGGPPPVQRQQQPPQLQQPQGAGYRRGGQWVGGGQSSDLDLYDSDTSTSGTEQGWKGRMPHQPRGPIQRAPPPMRQGGAPPGYGTDEEQWYSDGAPPQPPQGHRLPMGMDGLQGQQPPPSYRRQQPMDGGLPTNQMPAQAQGMPPGMAGQTGGDPRYEPQRVSLDYSNGAPGGMGAAAGGGAMQGQQGYGGGGGGGSQQPLLPAGMPGPGAARPMNGVDRVNPPPLDKVKGSAAPHMSRSGRQVVQCEWCTQLLGVPGKLEPSQQGIQKLRCGKCLKVSKFTVVYPSDGSSTILEPFSASASPNVKEPSPSALREAHGIPTPSAGAVHPQAYGGYPTQDQQHYESPQMAGAGYESYKQRGSPDEGYPMGEGRGGVQQQDAMGLSDSQEVYQQEQPRRGQGMQGSSVAQQQHPGAYGGPYSGSAGAQEAEILGHQVGRMQINGHPPMQPQQQNNMGQGQGQYPPSQQQLYGGPPQQISGSYQNQPMHQGGPPLSGPGANWSGSGYGEMMGPPGGMGYPGQQPPMGEPEYMGQAGPPRQASGRIVVRPVSSNAVPPMPRQSSHGNSGSEPEDALISRSLSMKKGGRGAVQRRRTISRSHDHIPVEERERGGRMGSEGREEEEREVHRSLSTKRPSKAGPGAASMRRVYTMKGGGQEEGEGLKRTYTERASKGGSGGGGGERGTNLSRSMTLADKDQYNRKVVVNGQPVPDRMVASVETRIGKIEAGKYWYDPRSGFWGPWGGPLFGAIPHGLKEFGALLPPPDCSSGNANVFINGRQLQKKELSLLLKKGLPDFPGSRFTLDADGTVGDTAGRPMKCIGKLYDEKKRGMWLRMPGK